MEVAVQPETHRTPGTPDEQMLKTACGFAGELADADAARILRLTGSAKMVRPVSPGDYYPSSSRRRGEQGSPVVQACVGPTGKLLREPVVTDSSGFPDLDAAAIEVAKATRYAAGTENGTTLPESCLEFKVIFGQKRD